MAKSYGRLTNLTSGIVKLRDNARAVGPDYEKVVDAFMTIAAKDGEAQMKERAPWNDSTGNRKDRVPGAARAGLNTTTNLKGPRKRIRFAHGVDYGMWLETNYNGRYQIIMPTVVKTGKQLMKRLRGALSTLREKKV